jgi:hypothetical protein
MCQASWWIKKGNLFDLAADFAARSLTNKSGELRQYIDPLHHGLISRQI